MSSILKRREVFYIQVQFVSPISISSGDNEWTDSDVLRNFDGEAFIPGTSLAGAMRSYLKKKKTDDCFMGYSKKQGEEDFGKMSSLFISDLTFDEETVSNVRDGVALDDNKSTIEGSKFDIEILEAGVKGHFYLELTVREDDNESEMNEELATIFNGINKGEIRLGSKKTRGFGEFKILSIASKIYDDSNYTDYANAYDDSEWKNEENTLQDWLEKVDSESQMVHIKVPLRLEGGISIRQYAAKKGEPDYAQLTDHGVPVIPGSSFAGAIRHRIELLCGELKLSKEASEIMFGFVKGKNANSSNVIINESEIKGAKPLVMVRTGVSRFESAARSGALYKEKTYVDGRLTLNISVRKGDNPVDEKWILGLLLLAIKDLQNGLLAGGGQTAIGRGVFSYDGPILIDGKENRENELITEALMNLKSRGGQ